MSLSKKSLVGITILMLIIYVLSAVFCFGIHSRTKKIISSQAIRSMENISQLNKDSISHAINNRRLLMEMLAARTEKVQVYEIDAIMEVLSDYQTTYEFYNMGLLDKDNQLHLTNDAVHLVPDKDFLKLVWNEEFHLMESRPSLDGKGYMVNTFACPIYRNGEIEYVLVATYRSGMLADRMNISSLEGQGDTFLIDENGKVVIYPSHYENEEYNALMNYINDSAEVLPKAGSNQLFTFEGEKYYANIVELGINDWYLLTCAKESAVLGDALSLMLIVYISVAVLWCIILIAACLTFYTMRRTRIRRTRDTYYDKLLSIPNLNALSLVYERLPHELLEDMYLVAFDIDKFKEFNYIYGSDNGDCLLQYIVRVLQEIEPEVYLFRYVSDFFVTLDTGKSRHEYEQKIKLVLERFERDVADGKSLPFDISAGVRKISPGEPLRLVVSDALVARETVKGNHQCHYAFYEAGIRDKRLKYMEIESDFPKALREQQFHVYYQPKYDMQTGEIIGAEALARWIKPDGTIISPADFIPCLESSRQIMLLDEEILKQVCVQMKEMEKEGIDIRRVSVNLSRVHLRNPGILEKIETILRTYDIDTSKLSFEITESVLYEDSIPLREIVDKLRSLGCRVEMDDYGVGVSGPNSLAKNNFDVVKLDKSLTDGLGNERVEDVIRSTAHMARKWGMEVLAEGVEEEQQAVRLLELGCFHAQGFYYSRPIPKEEYRALLKTVSD